MLVTGCRMASLPVHDIWRNFGNKKEEDCESEQGERLVGFRSTRTSIVSGQCALANSSDAEPDSSRILQATEEEE